MRKDYKDARYEATATVRGFIGDLIGPIDHFNRTIKLDAPSFNELITAHDERLQYKSLLAGASSYHGIAYLEHYLDLLERIKGVFERIAREAERPSNPETQVELKSARRVNEMYEKDYMSGVHKFFESYASEISAEKQSEEYSRDELIIEDMQFELEQVVKTGRWTPEIITINDTETGRPRQVETPSSERLGRIARMAPKLRQLGFGTEG